MQESDPNAASSSNSQASPCPSIPSRPSYGASWFLGLWIAASLFTGSMLLSFHLPFRTPASGVLNLSPAIHPGRPRILHILSGSCGCSQKIMLRLARRDALPGIDEQVLVVDTFGDTVSRDNSTHAEYLPGTLALLHTLQTRGFSVLHIDADHLPPGAGIPGVPLLVATSAQGDLTYLGGYGPGGDQDMRLFLTGLTTVRVKGEPVFGCAVGARLQKKTDPFHLKYRLD